MSGLISTGAQCLKITHCADGSATGLLECSVSLNLSQGHSAVFKERVPDVAVGLVLNPYQGVFLADEVQRLMRLGLAARLEQELSSERVKAITFNDTQTLQTVHFELGDLAGAQQTLSVDVEPAPSDAAAVSQAVERLHNWACSLPKHPPQEWVVEELLLADPLHAPLMHSGLAQVNACG